MTQHQDSAHPKKQSYRLWLGAADQCTMSHGTYIHIKIYRILNYTTESTLDTRQQTITISKYPIREHGHTNFWHVCLLERFNFNY